MKLKSFIIAFAVLLSSSVMGKSVMAQSMIGLYSAQVSPAETVFQGKSQGLCYIGIYDDALGLVSGLRYGIGGYSDVSFRLGFIDFDKNGNGFVLASDFRYQLMEIRIEDPLDLSAGGLLELVRAEDANKYSFGCFLVGSHNISLKEDTDLWPYGRLILRWDKYLSKSETNLGFNAGASFELNKKTLVSGELQFDDDFGFIIGIAFNF